MLAEHTSMGESLLIQPNLAGLLLFVGCLALHDDLRTRRRLYRLRKDILALSRRQMDSEREIDDLRQSMGGTLPRFPHHLRCCIRQAPFGSSNRYGNR